ncbi:carboxypeptidase-like regulatory domain-containing protein [Maribacter algicola]|uniref:Carboxypeptidase-like regulatory domain-containing protein n=1 Tax=Meishania litoralis TaxID=3434685 RepID=A0ACC7LJY7_9FLAO
MKKSICSLVFFLFCASVFSQELTKTIFGTISDDYDVLKGVNVIVKGSDIGVTSDNQGKYSIQAKKGDVLVFSRMGMLPIEIKVEDVTRVLNVTMFEKVEELKEVTVAKRKRRTQQYFAREYYRDSSIINSNFGYLSPELVGYELRVVDGKNLNRKARDILDAIAEQLPGFTVRTIRGERFLYVSSYGSLRGEPPVAYELDGHIWKEAPVELDIRKVVRIGVIPPDQSARRYGPDIAPGGMVIINTSDINHGSDEDGNRPFDLARLRGNIYQGDAISGDDIIRNEPNYIKALHRAKDFETAKSIYLDQSKIYGDSYFFTLDMFRIFREEFDELAFSDHILEVYIETFASNPVALKALAYYLQSYADFEGANRLYKEIFIQRPNYAQSYLDLANSYREIDDTKRAASLYARYNYLVTHDFLKKDTLAFGKIMDREFNNLITLNGRDILFKNEVKKSVLEEDFKGTRLVFEWNDSEAEFELQFVNPENHYYTSMHALIANAARIRDEKLLGYSCEEFLIDESLPGTWLVNAKYLGNKKLTPTYMKATRYYDYGRVSQRKETKVYKLGLRNVTKNFLVLRTLQELFRTKNRFDLVNFCYKVKI